MNNFIKTHSNKESTTTGGRVVLKIRFQRTDNDEPTMRRVPFTGPTTFANLQAAVFNDATPVGNICYIDDEGDAVRVSSNAEVADMLDFANANNVIRLIVASSTTKNPDEEQVEQVEEDLQEEEADEEEEPTTFAPPMTGCPRKNEDFCAAKARLHELQARIRLLGGSPAEREMRKLLRSEIVSTRSAMAAMRAAWKDAKAARKAAVKADDINDDDDNDDDDHKARERPMFARRGGRHGGRGGFRGRGRGRGRFAAAAVADADARADAKATQWAAKRQLKQQLREQKMQQKMQRKQIQTHAVDEEPTRQQQQQQQQQPRQRPLCIARRVFAERGVTVAFITPEKMQALKNNGEAGSCRAHRESLARSAVVLGPQFVRKLRALHAAGADISPVCQRKAVQLCARELKKRARADAEFASCVSV